MGLGTIKNIFLSGLTSDLGLAALAPFRPRCASVFFLHRFAAPELGVAGHDPARLRSNLEYLRARKYSLLSVGTLMKHIEEGMPLERTSVIFTVDDGYEDFATVAAPIFAEYDCPVTVFLITDFVSGRLWNWFDRVECAFRETAHAQLSIQIEDQRLEYRWRDATEREVASEELVERLKLVEDGAKERLIVEIARSLEVDLHRGVPARDKAMTWDQVRTCSKSGVTFGPHTMTHPILSRVDDAKAEKEISGSWLRVSAETEAAVPVFCYPNGTPADFSCRDEKAVARAGMKGGLSTVQASLLSVRSGLSVRNRFAIPRFSYVEGAAFVQIASGIEAMRGGSS